MPQTIREKLISPDERRAADIERRTRSLKLLFFRKGCDL